MTETIQTTTQEIKELGTDGRGKAWDTICKNYRTCSDCPERIRDEFGLEMRVEFNGAGYTCKMCLVEAVAEVL